MSAVTTAASSRAVGQLHTLETVHDQELWAEDDDRSSHGTTIGDLVEDYIRAIGNSGELLKRNDEPKMAGKTAGTTDRDRKPI